MKIWGSFLVVFSFFVLSAFSGEINQIEFQSMESNPTAEESISIQGYTISIDSHSAHACNMVFLSPKTAITAAHCLRPFEGKEFQISLGSERKNPRSDFKYFIHPTFEVTNEEELRDKSNRAKDIAVIEFDNEIDFLIPQNQRKAQLKAKINNKTPKKGFLKIRNDSLEKMNLALDSFYWRVFNHFSKSINSLKASLGIVRHPDEAILFWNFLGIKKFGVIDLFTEKDHQSVDTDRRLLGKSASGGSLTFYDDLVGIYIGDFGAKMKENPNSKVWNQAVYLRSQLTQRFLLSAYQKGFSLPIKRACQCKEQLVEKYELFGFDTLAPDTVLENRVRVELMFEDSKNTNESCKSFEEDNIPIYAMGFGVDTDYSPDWLRILRVVECRSIPF